MHPHRRFDPLSGQWVLVSPHRMQRPWQGQSESAARARHPAHDPDCYLCPGNQRAGAHRNPAYDGTFVFTNDFAALLPEALEPGGVAGLSDHASGPRAGAGAGHPLLHAEPVQGTCRVLCFSPRHDLTLAELDAPGLRAVVDLWAAQTAELGRTWRWVQVFENKGALMGASSPHPHGQVWATDRLPGAPAREDDNQREYFRAHGRPLLVDYADVEHAQEERIVARNALWIAVVPYWAMWPFELLLLPRRHVRRLPALHADERDALGDVLARLLARYDNLFETSFPYSMGWHGAPHGGDDEACAHWQLHAHFYPPLLRSATVRKFMVGYEMLAEAQRDLTPEQAAARLRAVSDIHYRQRA